MVKVINGRPLIVIKWFNFTQKKSNAFTTVVYATMAVRGGLYYHCHLHCAQMQIYKKVAKNIIASNTHTHTHTTHTHTLHTHTHYTHTHETDP